MTWADTSCLALGPTCRVKSSGRRAVLVGIGGGFYVTQNVHCLFYFFQNFFVNSLLLIKKIGVAIVRSIFLNCTSSNQR